MIVHQIFRDGVVVGRIEDNLDGTGTQYNYDENGNVTSTEARSDLPIPQLGPEERIATLEAALEALATP